MQTFKATLINEVHRMLRRRKAVLAAVLSLAVIVFSQLLVVTARLGFGIRGSTSAGFPILVLNLIVNVVIPLFATLVTLDAISGEFSRNTMKLALTRPVSRLKVFTAKISAVGIFVAGNLLAVMVLSVLSGMLFNPVEAVLSGLLRVIAAYVASLLPLMVWVLLVGVLAHLVRSGTGAFFLSILIFMALRGLALLLPGLSGIFPTSGLSWYTLWLAETLPVQKILTQGILMGAYALLLFLAGFWLFDKRDL